MRTAISGLDITLLTVTIAAFIGAIFIAVATWRLESLKYGLLTFLWSFIVALLGASAGFRLSWIWYR